MTEREQKLKDALKALGTTENKICAFLEEKKIIGKSSYADDCPVAHYLAKIFKNAKEILVDTDLIVVSFAKEKIEMKTPAVVARFLERFDYEEHYEHLNEANNPE